MPVNGVITEEDLQNFKRELLKEFRQMQITPKYVTYKGIFEYIIGHTIDETGKKVGIDPKTLKSWKNAGELRITKIGNINMYNSQDLLDLLENKHKYSYRMKTT